MEWALCADMELKEKQKCLRGVFKKGYLNMCLLPPFKYLGFMGRQL